MNVEIVSKKVVLSNPDSFHGYSGWPSVTRLQNGRLAMVASAFRINHVCPFGKCVISYSENEGETWSLPAPVIDTLLDDRDGGITAFGESDVIVTSFNNSIEFQRNATLRKVPHYPYKHKEYVDSYLDILEREFDWKKYLGSTFRMSHDGGTTFGEIKKIPVTCPHGPAALSDGTLLYIGSRKSMETGRHANDKCLACYKVFPDGSYEYMGEIPRVTEDLVSCEPHTIVLSDGTVLVHIRVQGRENTILTIYQSESYDGGRTFTEPHQILANKGGAPAHIIQDGDTLISTYSYREAPYGIRAMFSQDNGKTWETDVVLVDDGISWDIGYPASVVLKDGNILTVYYGKTEKDAPGVIMQVIWNYKKF